MTRYARLEVERRWWLLAVPERLHSPRRIEDRYLSGTGLRLRLVTEEGGAVVRKLGHKVRDDAQDPRRVWHTSIYLDAAGWETLTSLPGDDLVKVRYATYGVRWVVDVFGGRHKGLVMAEIEGDEDEGSDVGAVGPNAVEVSADERFTGGRLAVMDGPAVERLVAEMRERIE